MVSAWKLTHALLRPDFICCGPSTFVYWTVHFNQGPSNFGPLNFHLDPCGQRTVRTIHIVRTTVRTVHFLKSSNTTKSAKRWTLPQRGIILQKLRKKKCWILLVILLLSIVGIAVGLSIHFTATEPATTTPVPLLIATTASSIPKTTEGNLFSSLSLNLTNFFHFLLWQLQNKIICGLPQQ